MQNTVKSGHYLLHKHSFQKKIEAPIPHRETPSPRFTLSVNKLQIIAIFNNGTLKFAIKSDSFDV